MTANEETSDWVPLSLRDTQTGTNNYKALVDGVPQWLERSLWRWVMDRAAQGSMPLIYEVERHLRVDLHAPGVSLDAQSMLNHYWSNSGDEERLTLIDYLLRDQEKRYDAIRSGRLVSNERPQATIVSLEEILIQGGSLWKAVAKPHWGLEQRVNETTRAQVDLVTSAPTDAARKIASAWNACYRPEPNYDIAYRDAVLAVEAVTLGIALPKSNTATLGTVVAHIADTVGNWTVGGLDAAKQASGETLLAMLRTLWHNQQRHANPGGSIKDVTRAEAEAALGIAVTLVLWFSSGLARRISTRVSE
ncbi:hypothetical protein E0H73_22030 [Kribbella pittospori]|uniref:Abortive infection protein-like C-terminal domain-containing protein n=1 Tax=Kribbella pittospori TaxID=722689 RepID=A0A4R0KIZ7_9ACTN|nr:hypothetical protein [Kribbella pittospori]TCC60603.1 hypothetical protein E0H73_22030 [Kribbella pittospori]